MVQRAKVIFMKPTLRYLFIVSIICLVYSCGNESVQIKQRNEKIDSLAHVLAVCEEEVDLPVDEIRERLEKIEYDRKNINAYNTTLVDQEFSFVIDNYISIGKVYERYLANHVLLEQELKDLKKQLSKLKKSSDSGKIADKDFGSFLNTERTDILHLKEMVEEFAEPVSKAEVLYIRVAPKVSHFADSVYEKNKEKKAK
jgi:hypothetical protein